MATRFPHLMPQGRLRQRSQQRRQWWLMVGLALLLGVGCYLLF